MRVDGRILSSRLLSRRQHTPSPGLRVQAEEAALAMYRMRPYPLAPPALLVLEAYLFTEKGTHEDECDVL